MPLDDLSRREGEAAPTFTVVINTYNYLAFLPQAIGSIVAQTFADHELIVVDDGSTDGSIAYLENLDLPFTMLRTERLGQARACLMAIARARGRYIYILDADDLATPDLLETVARHLAGAPSKVQFRLVPVDEEGLPFAPAYPICPPGYGAAAQRADIRRTGAPTSPPTSGNVFRRDLFDAVGDIGYETAIDGVTLLLAPFLGEVVSLDASLGFYRVHGGGHSAHSNPLDPIRVRRDRERFAGRLTHLGDILRRMRPAEPALDDPRSHLFHWDQLTLEAVAEGRRVTLEVAAKFAASLLRRHGLTAFSARKTAWLAVALAAPRSVQRRMLTARLDPWPRRARIQDAPFLTARPRTPTVAEARE